MGAGGRINLIKKQNEKELAMGESEGRTERGSIIWITCSNPLTFKTSSITNLEQPTPL